MCLLFYLQLSSLSLVSLYVFQKLSTFSPALPKFCPLHSPALPSTKCWSFAIVNISNMCTLRGPLPIISVFVEYGINLANTD